MTNTYYPPSFGKGQFHCPHCRVYAKQFWSHLRAMKIWGNDWVLSQNSVFHEDLDIEWRISNCEHCHKKIIWMDEEIVYPSTISVDPPNNDLAEDIQNDYLEAASILSKSPRGAAALLRLALQKLLKQLGEDGGNINNDIKKLFAKGLNPTIKNALDYVRVTGNNAVHPGEIDLNDKREIAEKLFQIINFVAEKMITEPMEIDNLFMELPNSEKKKIEKRDKTIKKE